MTHLCDCAAVRLCGGAAVRLCGCAAVRLCGCAAVHTCDMRYRDWLRYVWCCTVAGGERQIAGEVSAQEQTSSDRLTHYRDNAISQVCIGAVSRHRVIALVR